MQIIVDADSRRLSLGPTPPVRGETIPSTLTFMKGGVPFRLPAGTAIQIGVKSWSDPSDVLLAYTTATRPEPDGAPYTFSLSLNTSEMLAKFTAGVTRYDCSIEVKWEVSAGSGTFKKTQRHKYSVDADTVRDTDANPSTMLSRNDFLVTNGTGLLVNVAAGYAANGAFVAAQASLAITNATNYIEVTAAGVASVNTTAFTAGSYPLATVVASAGAITANTDLRAWITPKPAAGDVTSITGTANEITVTGTTTPTLSLPSALTFTAKTITGGTFASPTLTTPTIGDGTEAAPSLSFTSDTNTGVYRPAADTVGIVGGGNDVVRLTGIASATDYLEIKNGIGVGSPLHVLAEGASANIGVHLQPKGSGLFTISDGTDFNKGIRFRSSSSAASAITLLDAVSSAGRVITLPDATGTLALVSGNLGTPSALVGTNITGTASGLTAGNATLAATVTVANEATDTTCFPLFATAATGSLAALSNAGLTFNSATGLLSATGLAGAFNGTVGATTPSTVAGTNGTFSGSVSTSGDLASVSTNGSDASIYTTGIAAEIYTTGIAASIFTTGANAYIESRSTFNLNGGTFKTTLSHAATADRAIAFPDAAGTLLLADGSGANLTALNADNVSSGTLAAARGGTGVSNTGTITLGGNLVTTGAFNTTFAQAATTTVTLPATSATMARTDAGQTFTGVNVFTSPKLITGISDTNGNTLMGITATASAVNSITLANAATGLGPTFTATGTDASVPIILTTRGTAPVANVKASGATWIKTVIGSYASPTYSSDYGIAGAADQFVTGSVAGDVVFKTSGGGRFLICFASAGSGAGTLRNSGCFYPSGGVALGGFGTDPGQNNASVAGTLAVTGATTLTGNLTSNGALISTPQALTGAGAVNVTTLTTAVTTTAPAQALTLANGTNGQIKTIVHQALSGGGTWVLTPTTKTGYTTITSTAVGETCTLQFFTTIGWCILSLRGAIAA